MNDSPSIGQNERALLRDLARQICDPARAMPELIGQVVALRELLERQQAFDFTPEVHMAESQSWLDCGLAVSPLQAALCAREVLRSIAFIKGAAAAVAAARPAEQRPVRVLYAGCGPYALLALPLMALLTPQQVSITLLDIHPEALACARDLVERFGFAGHVGAFVCADATRHLLAPAPLPDVIVSETMNVCLGREPQVAITRHLLAQAPHAIMVPAAIRVDACLLDPAREASPAGPCARERVELGTVFELSARHVAAWAALDGATLPAARIGLPAAIAPKLQFRLLTRIEVSDGISLSDYDGSLNLPQSLPGKPVFGGGEQLQFHYRLGANPGLAYDVKACGPASGPSIQAVSA
ncbi:MAG: hypothetical protein V4857_29850 [Pseudomonadota bacterium]